MGESERIKEMIAKHRKSIRVCEVQIQKIHSEISAGYDEEWVHKCSQVAMKRIIENLQARLENPEGPWPQSIDEMEHEALADLASAIGTR